MSVAAIDALQSAAVQAQASSAVQPVAAQFDALVHAGLSGVNRALLQPRPTPNGWPWAMYRTCTKS